MIWVEIGAKRKKSQKSDIFNLKISLFAISTYHFKSITHIPLPHCCCTSGGHPPLLPYSSPSRTTTHTGHAHKYARTRAPSNSDVVFCCHKCHRRYKFRWKNLLFLDNEEEKQSLFRDLILCMFGTWIMHLLKYIQTNIVSNWNTADYYIPSDTCDSKNAKTLAGCVRVRARERVIIGIFTIPIFYFYFRVKDFSASKPLLKTTRRFQQNNTSFPTKQHDVSNKTTRCFQQNNTMFSTKQHDVFDKTNR